MIVRHHTRPSAGVALRFPLRGAFLCLALLPVCAHAQEGERAAWGAVTLRAEAGLGGYARPGTWLPLHAWVENAGEEVSGRLEARVGKPPAAIVYRRELRLAGGARQRHLLLVRVDNALRDLPVHLGDAQVSVPVQMIDSNDRLVLAVSEDQSALNFLPMVQLASAGTGARGMAPPRSVRVAHTTAADLYETALAYDSVDLIALGTASLRPLAPAQRDALRHFVEDGGTLLVSGGADVARLADPLLRDLLPVRNATARPLASLAALGRRFGTPLPANPAVVAAAQPLPDAEVWVSQGDVPLVVSHPYGSGRVIFTAFDYDQAPVRGWTGQMALWKEILTRNRGEHFLATDPQRSLRVLAMLAGAVANNASMDLPSARLIGLFFLAYILCLVPINYYVLRRLDRREYAWATTPGIVLLFCLLALGIGYGTKGRTARLYRLDFLEADAGARIASGASYLGLWSPGRHHYTLEAPLAMGLTEGGDPFGHAPDTSVRGYTVAQSSGMRLEDVGLYMNSMRVFSARARQEIGGGVDADLRLDAGGLQGEIRNLSRLRLEGGLVMNGRDSQLVGALSPGGTVKLDPKRWAGYTGPWQSRQRSTRSPVDSATRIREAAVDALRNELSLGTASGGPRLLAWGPAAPGQVRLVGRRSQETAVALYLFHLAPPRATGSFTVKLPGRVVEQGPNATVDANGTFYLSNTPGSNAWGSVVYEFNLPDNLVRLDRLTVRADHWQQGGPGLPPSPANALEVACLDPASNQWVSFPWQGNTVQIAHPIRFLHNGNRVRVRLAVRADDLNVYELRQVEVTAEGGGPAGSARHTTSGSQP